MTTTVTEKTFVVRYPVVTYHAVEVTRPSDITEDELLQSITREELVSGEVQDDCAWDTLKMAWRDCDAEVFVYDEDECLEYCEF